MAKGRKTGGRKKGSRNKAQPKVRQFAFDVVEDEEYRRNFLARARAGTLAPQVEVNLWHLVYGKPAETHELTGADGGPIRAIIIKGPLDG